jgi:hypothetical protein
VVRYELALDQPRSMLCLHIQIEFERVITDEPDRPTSVATSSYEFTGVFLEITTREQDSLRTLALRGGPSTMPRCSWTMGFLARSSPTGRGSSD